VSDKSAIEWTDATWNPVTGCSKVSPGCANCYAETLSLRFGHSKRPWTPANAAENVVLHPERLGLPLKWREPRMVFVNSMSDLFHELVPDGYVARVWDVMGKTPHTFQVLTKRPGGMRDWMLRWVDRTGDTGVDPFAGQSRNRGPEATRAKYTSGRSDLFAAMLESMGTPPPDAAYPTYDWMEGWRYWPRVLPNVWLGTSIENDRWTGRADSLRDIPAAVRFLSLEPLLGPLPSLDLTGIGWVIVGGESGPGARPMHSDWVRDIRDRCVAAGVPFFFKQWGAWGRGSYFRNGGQIMARDGRLADPDKTHERFGAEHPANLNLEWIRRVGKGAAGRDLDGRTWDEMPRTADGVIR
jgi:protein gp37